MSFKAGRGSRAPRGARYLVLAAALSIACGRSSSAQSMDAAVRSDSIAGQTESQGLPPGNSAPALRARRFMAGRGVETSAKEDPGASASARGRVARALGAARQQHAALAATVPGLAAHRNAISLQGAEPRLTPLNAAWQPVGPDAVKTTAYGKVSGRVTAVSIDPTDATGNTVYVGTTGGGVWKSTNAAGPAGVISFVPLTDTLPVLSANAGTAALASLSIGALSVQSGVVLAGTGDPNDATDSYYGSGVLRSADGGATWTLVQHSQDGVGGDHSFLGLGFAGFAWSSTAQGLVVAAVSDAAEGTVVNAADETASRVGLYYSSDAGVTWHLATVTDASGTVQSPTTATAEFAATSVVWNPVRRRFYAALRYRGYYESADGANWTRMAAQPGSGLTVSACLSGFTSCPIFRGVLAVQPMSGDTFALTVDRNNVDQGLWQDVCSANGSGCAGPVAFGTRLGGTALELGGGSSAILQGDYNLTLAAVSSGTNTVLYAGTVDVFRCTISAGGASSCALRNTTNAVNGCAAAAKVAPAQHAIAVLSGAGTGGPPLVFVGNDGGLWRSLDGIDQQAAVCSTDDATHFDNLNGGLGSLAEIVRFAQHPTDTGTLLAGLGANGTAAVTGKGVWDQLSAGEGGAVAIDAANPLNWYLSNGPGVSVKACGRGAACTAADFAGTATVGSAQVSGDASLIDAPWMLDPIVPRNLLVGTCRVWRGPASGGSLWSGANAISRMFAGGGLACVGTSAIVRSLAAGGPGASAMTAQNAGATVLYAGMAGSLDGGGTLGGHVFATTGGGTASSVTTWIDSATSMVTNGFSSAGKFNPGGFDVSAVSVDFHDATGKTVYATVMGFAGNTINAPHLYRSVDGGSHWLNVSSNLPNAPANDLAVDPNDANTLYVAMDTGVYVTTQISNCATTNCWSVYGMGLPNAPAMQLAVASAMSTGDGRTGELRVGTYGRGIWQIPLLTAVSAAVPAMSLTPATVIFASQSVGSASSSQTVTVTNGGTSPLDVSQVAVTGDFHTTDTCVANPVPAGGTCAVQVSFLPSATGTRSGVLTVYGNVVGGQGTVALSGTATPANAIVLNPVTILFPAVTLGAASAAQNVTISNTGSLALNLASVNVSGDFAITANTCGSSLAGGVGCTVSVVLKPADSGVRTGSLTVIDDVGTQTTTLSGSGTAPATDALTPLSLSFPARQLNTASAAQQVVLTNAGDVALTLIAAQVTSGDFSVVNGCGNSLNAHSSCSMGVLFVPKSLGAGNGVLAVSDQFRSQTIALSGTGLAPAGVSLSPVGTLGFGAVAVGSSSVAQVVTLTNNGGVALSVASVTLTGDFALAAGGTCGATVAVGATCSLPIVFAPNVGGVRNGTLTVTDNASSSPQVEALTGSGVDFALSPNGSTSVAVSNGRNAVFPLLLSSAAGVPGVATLTCTGVPAHATCVVSPASVGLGATTSVSVTVLTGVSTAALRPGMARRLFVWLACLLPLGLVVQRRRFLGLAMLYLLAGCGSGRNIPADGNGTGAAGVVTPTGSYSVVVSATSAGLVKSVELTVVVQ